MKKKRKNPVPYPYSKFISQSGWKKLRKEDRKIVTDIVKLQNRLWKHYKDRPPEEYVNMNAEIEYLKSIGEH